MVKIQLQCRRHGRSREFSPWVEKIPWRRKWQPTPVFLPGESHGQRSLVGYSPWGHERVGCGWVTEHSRIRQEVLTCCLPRSCLMGWAEPGTCWRLFPAAAAWTISQFPHLSSGNGDCPYLTWVLCARHNVFSAGLFGKFGSFWWLLLY